MGKGPKLIVGEMLRSSFPVYDSPEYAPGVLSASYGVIAAYSQVEASQLRCYMFMLGGGNEMGGRAYLALRSRSAKMSVLQSVAHAFLNKEEKEIFDKLLSTEKPLEKFRNKLAHWQLHLSNDKKYLYIQNPLNQYKTPKKPPLKIKLTELQTTQMQIVNLSQAWKHFFGYLSIHRKSKQVLALDPDHPELQTDKLFSRVLEYCEIAGNPSHPNLQFQFPAPANWQSQKP